MLFSFNSRGQLFLFYIRGALAKYLGLSIKIFIAGCILFASQSGDPVKGI
jgi:hypothetical protein